MFCYRNKIIIQANSKTFSGGKGEVEIKKKEKEKDKKDAQGHF